MANSLANFLAFRGAPRQIPAASPEFLASMRNPNIYQPQVGGGLAEASMWKSLANFFGGGGSPAVTAPPVLEPVVEPVGKAAAHGIDKLRSSQQEKFDAIKALTQ